MRGVWVYADGKPVGIVLGRSQWEVWHALGRHRFTRKDSTRPHLLEWAEQAFVGEIEVRWGDEELEEKTMPRVGTLFAPGKPGDEPTGLD